MLKLAWVWSELYIISPAFVERCASVFQLTAARRALRKIYGDHYELMKLADLRAGDLDELHPDNQLQVLDDQYQASRRKVWMTLLVVGLILTVQPWFALGWFSMVLLIAGVMLCGLEFSPRTEQGFIAMVLRFRAAKNRDE